MTMPKMIQAELDKRVDPILAFEALVVHMAGVGYVQAGRR